MIQFSCWEAVIATDARHACEYAINVLDARFLRAEKTIAKNREWAYEYADYFDLKVKHTFHEKKK